MTLTFEFYLDMVIVNQHAKHLGQRSFNCPRTQTRTHTGPNALPGPLKWCVRFSFGTTKRKLG